MRAALGGITVAFGTLELVGLAPRNLAVWVVGLMLLLSGTGLIVGFLTPFASLVAAVCVLGFSFAWFPGPPVASPGPLTLLIVVTAAAIALLGPGAFSLDGVLFGRREIVIPPRPPVS